MTRPPSCCVTRPRAWSRTSILNRFASLLAGADAERQSQLRRLVSPAFGCGPSPSSAWVFNRITPLRRLAIKNGVEQGHGTQSNRLGIKDLWPSASRSGLTVIREDHFALLSDHFALLSDHFALLSDHFALLSDHGDRDALENRPSQVSCKHFVDPSTMSPHAHLARSPVGIADKVWLEAVGREPGENSPWYRSHVLAQRPKLASDIDPARVAESCYQRRHRGRWT